MYSNLSKQFERKILLFLLPWLLFLGAGIVLLFPNGVRDPFALNDREKASPPSAVAPVVAPPAPRPKRLVPTPTPQTILPPPSSRVNVRSAPKEKE